MEIDVKDEQFSNAYSPIAVTEFGIVIDVKDVHQRNADSPIDVTVLGIVMESDMYFGKDDKIVVLSLSYRMPFSIMKFWPIDMFAGFNLLHP